MRQKFVPIMSMSIIMFIFKTISVNANTDLNLSLDRDRYNQKQATPSVNTLLTHLTPLKLAQAQVQTSQSEATEEIVKPNRSSISNLESLKPNVNPLFLPTQLNEVEIDTLQPITIEQAIELALKNNKDIVEARIEIERSRFVLREERAALFPTLDFTGGLSNYQNSGFLDSVAEQEAEAGIPANSEASFIAQNSFLGFSSEIFDFNPSLGLSYDIYDGGLRGALIRTAEKQLRIIELGLEIAAEEIRLETARNYYALQNGDASVEIAEAAVRDATKTLSDAQFLEEAGVGTQFDIMRAKVELAEAKQSLINATADREISRQQLAETLSIPDNASLAAADPVELAGAWELSLPESIVLASKNRPELEQFLLQREIGEEQRTVALSQIRPTITASAAYALLDNFEDNFDIVDEYSLGLSIQWRLFDGGAAKAGAQQAEKDIEIAETEFANERNEISFAVKQAYLQLESNRNNINTATEEVELAAESLEMARLRFQEGIGTQTDVIDAQTQLTAACDRLLSSIIVYNQSLADLRRQVSNASNDELQGLP